MNATADSGIEGEKTDRIEWAARSLARWRGGRIAKRHEAAGSRSAVTVADGQVVERGAEVCRCPSSVHMIPQDRGRGAKMPWTKGQPEGVDIAK